MKKKKKIVRRITEKQWNSDTTIKTEANPSWCLIFFFFFGGLRKERENVMVMKGFEREAIDNNNFIIYTKTRTWRRATYKLPSVVSK